MIKYVCLVLVATLATACVNEQFSSDRQAWQFFVEANVRAPRQGLVMVNGAPTPTNSALWETWADDGQTFPSAPIIFNPPVWPGDEPVPKQLHPSMDLRKMAGLSQTPTLDPISDTLPTSEEIRRNKVSFDFIVQQQLWYQEGLAAAHAAGTPIVFPVDAMEVKANWRTISEADKPRYHWNYTSDGQLYGLVAMHIMTKHLPNWTWATFEHVDNLGRCDYLGCHDDFGSIPTDISSLVGPTTSCHEPAPTTSYPPGNLTSELRTLMEQAGLGPEWTYYRLKGTQTDFESSNKRSLLGNSVTEGGFVATASCITCHSQAAVDPMGVSNPSLGFTPQGCSPNGPRQPAWFIDQSTSPPSSYFPVDFEWGVLNAQPLRNFGF